MCALILLYSFKKRGGQCCNFYNWTAQF